MKFLRWMTEEIKSIIYVTLYFAACFATIMALKRILLAEYGIEFRGLSTALIGALVTAKVVIILEKFPLARWLRVWPAMADVIIRSAMYTFATLLVLLLEKAFESRLEHGSLLAAATRVFEHRDIHHVWATTVCVGLSFLAYNAFGIVRREVGTERLVEMFLSRNATAG